MDLPDKEKEQLSFIIKYKKHIAAIVVILVIMFIVFNLEGYTNYNSSTGKQIRSDPASDKKWNIEQFEKSVASLNSKTN